MADSNGEFACGVKREREGEPGEEGFSSAVKRAKLMEQIKSSLPSSLSKSQQKKQAKLQYWKETKQEWKQKKKEKEKQRKKEKQSIKGDAANSTDRKISLKLMSSCESSPLRIAIELGYQDLMTEKDIKMLMKQCQRCYSTNRRAAKPVQLYFTNFNGKCKDRLDNFSDGYKKWDINFREESFLKVFDLKDIIFLTAESPNIITNLENDKVYIIGGLVDHNRYKGHCHQQAVTAGVSHGRLPITEHVSLNSRAVLAVNHVFEVLLAYEEHKDWNKAVNDVIPQRKKMTPEMAKDDEPNDEPLTTDEPSSTDKLLSSNKQSTSTTTTEPIGPLLCNELSINDGSSSINDGTSSINDGTSSINDGSSSTNDGPSSTNDGSSSINDGTLSINELSCNEGEENQPLTSE